MGLSITFPKETLKIEGKGTEWDYEVYISDWIGVYLEDKQFTLYSPYDERIEKKVKEKVNKGFYELLRQIKQDKEYRLKIINLLNNEMRKVWNEV